MAEVSIPPDKPKHAGFKSLVNESVTRILDRVFHPERKRLMGALSIKEQRFDVFEQSGNQQITQEDNAFTYLPLVETQIGTIVLASHRDKTGKITAELKEGDRFRLEMNFHGKHTTKEYEIVKKRSVRALNPRDPLTNYINLDENDNDVGEIIDKRFASKNLFSPENGGHVVLQTCIVKENQGIIEPYWGRLMVYAKEV